MGMNTKRIIAVTFDQHHTAGALKGLVTQGTLAFGSESSMDRWRLGVGMNADRNGYSVANVRAEEMTADEYRLRTYGK